ncbi:MAG: hypothetical protein C0397_14855 [Odoribacter sp.]|nr:hypothetical protein [Odoribacter sp.]
MISAKMPYCNWVFSLTKKQLTKSLTSNPIFHTFEKTKPLNPQKMQLTTSRDSLKNNYYLEFKRISSSGKAKIFAVGCYSNVSGKLNKERFVSN